MTRKNKPDPDERAIIAAYGRGELKPVKNMKAEMKKARAAAAKHIRKDARINIRLSETDLLMLKRKAADEGMPYQTLISSVLHKFVHGRI